MWKFPGSGSNRSCSHWPSPEPQQRRIQAASATYTIAHGNAGSLTYWARPGIKPATSWFLVGFVNHWATTGTPTPFSFALMHSSHIDKPWFIKPFPAVGHLDRFRLSLLETNGHRCSLAFLDAFFWNMFYLLVFLIFKKFLIFGFLPFLGPLSRHMEVLRLGV